MYGCAETIFAEADDNGDGVLTLKECCGMIRERRPSMTDAEAFKVYDDALALSEHMLGYETDAILAEAFVRTAIGHNLFSNIGQPLRTADGAADEPPPRWGAAAVSASEGETAESPLVHVAGLRGGVLRRGGAHSGAIVKRLGLATSNGGGALALSASVPMLPAKGGRVAGVVGLNSSHSRRPLGAPAMAGLMAGLPALAHAGAPAALVS